MFADRNLVRFRLIGIKNLSANSCESLGAAHDRALGHRLPPAEAAQLGKRADHRVLQQNQAGPGEVPEIGRVLEIVVDGHRRS